MAAPPRGTVHVPSERAYVYAVSFSHALVHAMEIAYAALLLRIEEAFGTDLLTIGVLATVGAFAFGLGALPSGLLTDRLGSVRVIRMSLGGSAVAAVIVALAGSELMLGVALALLGLASGLYHPAGVALLAGTARRSRNFGLHGALGNLGIAAAPAALVGLAVLLDWRAAYALLAALAAVGFLIVLRLNPAGPAAPAGPPPASASVSPAAPARPRGWRPLIVVYAAFIVAGFIYRGSYTFIPTHVEEQIRLSIFGLNPTAVAGSLTTLALLGGALGWYLGGHAADRFRLESIIFLMSLLVVPALFLISVAGGAVLILVIAVFTMANFVMQPSFMSLVAEYAPAGRLGASYGVSFFMNFGVGSVAGVIAGAAADAWGTDAVFLVLAGVACISIGLAGVLATRARARGTPAPAPS